MMLRYTRILDGAGNLRHWWDDDSRTYTAYDDTGQVTETRPYTAAESARADAEALVEQARHEEEARAQAQAALLDATLALSKTANPDGAAWAQPTGAHNAYPVGATVTHDGKTWVSLTLFNVWEPGVSGWREATGTTPPKWVQPTGAHDAYKVGDRVTHNSKTWVNTLAANTYEPGVYGWEIS